MRKKDKLDIGGMPIISKEWRDKKRYFGKPISFTSYSVSNGRLYIKRGFFTTHYDEVMLFRIFDIKMVETLWQKIFKVGTVLVYTSDASSWNKIIRLINIKSPLAVRDYLSCMVETARDEKGIQGAEFVGPYV